MARKKLTDKEIKERRLAAVHKYNSKNKETIRRRKKQYREKNPEKIKEYSKKYHVTYYQRNKEKLQSNSRDYHKNNRDKINQRKREYNKKNKDRRKKYQDEYYKNNKYKAKLYNEKNKDVKKGYMKIYRKNNRKKLNKKDKEWHIKNPKKKKEYNKKYYHKDPKKAVEKASNYKKKNRDKVNKRNNDRLKNDINYRVSVKLTGRIRILIKRNEKFSKTLDLLGCSVDDFKKNIESKFTEGMSWDNYGIKGWHFDHIIPCDVFDLRKQDAQKICFHYTNYQPLWATDNLKKGNKVDIELLRKLDRNILKEKYIKLLYATI